MVESTPGQKQAGTAGVTLGAGCLFSLLGTIFEDAIGTIFTSVGLLLITLGSVLLGMAAKRIRDERLGSSD